MDDIQFSEFLDESIPLWRNDPVMFFREVLNFEPDEWQAEAARDLAANPKVSIKSGQGVGKTGLEAAVFLWFITCFPYPRIVATAPTKQQLHDVLWSEISKWMSKSELLSMLLKWTKTYDILWSYNADDRYHHNIRRLLGYTRSFRQNRL